MSSPTFFETPADFRKWLEEHHETASELIVGFRRRDSKMPSITWPESVDEALCFGWIDGIRRSLDETSYTIRFTPRKPKSAWSAVNLRRVEALIADGRMRPAGLRAWQNRSQSSNFGYSYGGPLRELGEAEAAEFKKHGEAWRFFQAQAPFYQRGASYWVMSAKREETRQKRLGQLIEDSAAGKRLEAFSKYKKNQ